MKHYILPIIIPTILLSNENSSLDKILANIDETVNFININLNNYSKNLDEFLTNQYDESIYDRSYIKFENSFEYDKYGDFSYTPKFTLRLKLPKLQKRFSLEIDNTENSINQNINENNIDIDSNEKVKFKDDNYSIGLIYNRISKDINLSFKSGVKVSANSFVYIKTSAFKTVNINENSEILIKDEIRFSDRYKIDNSFIINYNYIFNEKYQFSNYNEYFFNSIKKDDEIYNSIRLTDKINDKRYLNYVFSIYSNNINSELEIKDYTLYLSHRKYIKNWLYFDVIPSLTFQQIYDYNVNPGIKFNLGIISKK